MAEFATDWLGGPEPALRLEARYGDRIVPCFVDRPPGLSDLLAEAVRRNPGGEALVCGAERLTWREVADRVAALAGGLRRRGIGPGDRVAMLLGNRIEFPLVLFAIARLGAVSVPMGIRQQRPELAFALADCGAAALIHEDDLTERVPGPDEVPSLRLRVAVPGRAGAEPFAAFLDGDPVDPAAVSEEETATILYTSGTTGRPKGAMLSHGNIVHSAMVYEHCMAMGAADRSLAAVPLSHVTGLVANIAATVRCAGTLIVMPEFKAPAFLHLAAAERVTHTLMVPAMYNLCLLQPDLAGYDLSAWRIGGYGGAPMPPATIAALAERVPDLLLINAYGATETTSPTTMLPPSLAATHADKVGRPVPGATILIVDEAGRALPPGEPGEIWIHGPHVVKGYWANEAATRANLTAGFWHSGDIGAMDADGYVSVLDRKKDMLNRGGHKIYTAEVEAVLAGHPAVVESAVIGRPCPVLGERVHAIVVLRDAAACEGDLRGFCAERLADYKVPESFTIRPEPLPRNSNGKVMKRALRDGVPSPA